MKVWIIIGHLAFQIGGTQLNLPVYHGRNAFMSFENCERWRINAKFEALTECRELTTVSDRNRP